MNNKLENNFVKKEKKPILPNINNQETNISLQKLSDRDYQDSKDKDDRSILSAKLKITEHYEIKSKESLPKMPKLIKQEDENQFEKEKNKYINDYYSEESDINSPKIIDGKIAVDINEILGEEANNQYQWK